MTTRHDIHGIPSQCNQVAPTPPHYRCHLDHNHEGPHITGKDRAWVNESSLCVLLASMDEWLGNEDGLMIEDIIGWRDRLALALGKGPRE
jgi:hypothetical protein